MAQKISVTFLSSYLYCPRKLYLEQVLKIFKIPKEAVIKGTIRHETYEGINNCEKDLVTSIKKEQTFEEVFSEYKRVYTKLLRKAIIRNKNALTEAGLDLSVFLTDTLPSIIDEAKDRATNTYQFSKKTNLEGLDLWIKITPKIESEVRVESNALGLKGIIDEIRKYEDELVPVELKTGKAPERGVWDGHKIQIGAYILLLEEKKTKKIKEGVVKYLDYKLERQVIMDPFLKKDIIELVKKVNELLASKTLPPQCEQKNKCNACNLYTECNSSK